MHPRPLSVTAALVLICVSALVWLALGVIIAAGLHPAMPHTPAIRSSMAFGSLLAGAVLAFIVILLWRRIRVAYYLALAALIASSLALFFDDVGWADVILLALGLMPLFLLIRNRAWYLRDPVGHAPGS